MAMDYLLWRHCQMEVWLIAFHQAIEGELTDKQHLIASLHDALIPAFDPILSWP